MSNTIYRKYRPQTWADVAGQNHVKVTLAFEAATGKVAHAYLFSGPRGIGKTTVARILARAVNCDAVAAKRGTAEATDGEPCGSCEGCLSILEGRALDVIEIDAASNRGIDNVRENIIENARFSPARLAYKVFIIDEVHMLTTEAFNALLKTLEEPPATAMFILATTELHKVPPTIVSRCQRFDFKKIPFTDLVERLHRVAEREKVKVDRRALEEVARHSDGCLRDAEGLLGKVLTVGDGKRVTYDEAMVVLPRSDYASLASFVEALLRRDGRSALITVGDCLENGCDMEQFAGDAIELMRKVLLAKMSGNPDIFAFDLDEKQKKDLLDWAALADERRLVEIIEMLLEKRRDIRTSHPAQLPLELAAVRLCGDPSAPTREEPPGGSATMSRDALTPRVTANLGSRAAAPAHDAVPERAAEERATVAAASSETFGDGAAPVTTIDSLKSLWDEFIRRAGEENHALPFLLGVGEPVNVSGQQVKIGFDFAFHRDKMNEAKNRRLLEKVLGEIVKAKISVEGVLLDRKRKETLGDDAVSEAVPAAPVAAVSDSLLSAFGGRVVE